MRTGTDPSRRRRLHHAAWVTRHADRGAWMTAAHDTHGYTLAEIAAVAGLHYVTVSKIIKAWRSGDNATRKAWPPLYGRYGKRNNFVPDNDLLLLW